MDVEDLIKKIKKIETMAKEVLDEIKDCDFDVSDDVEGFMKKQDRELNPKKKSKIDKILALMEE